MTVEPENLIELSFLGGAGEIGASCCHLRIGPTNLLIDAGIRFKGDSKLPDLAPLNDLQLDAILVTHAHTDHTGALPVLSEAFPGVPIFATPPTIDLIRILTRDALKIMGSGEGEGDVPLYSEKQVEKMMDVLVPQAAHQRLEIGCVVVNFLPASHILGASMIHLETPSGNILFTGDYSVTSQRTVPALTRPALPVDMVITESTYGNRLHEDRKLAEERLLAQLKTVLEGEGQVLIPAFAIGRAQEILLIIKDALRHGRLPEVPVYVDGMVRAVCDVYARHENWVCRSLAKAIRNDRHPFYTNGIQRVNTSEDRKKILDGGPCIIVASSGMLTGGASAFYASKMAGKEKNAILLTGYQDEESPGSALLKLAAMDGATADSAPARSLKVSGKIVEVRCTFATYGLSAHADRLQMVALLEALRPRTVILVHGGREAKIALAGSLSCRDVVKVENGAFLQRSFRKNRRTSISGHSLDINVETARTLLGPAGSTPLRVGQVCEAWFGRITSGEEQAALVSRLEELELVRRDDDRRSLLWVLAPGQTDALADEAQQEATLKETNPKGKLLELCMRAQIDLPVPDTGMDGAFYTARIQMNYEGQALDSGLCRAAGKKTCEQLAAQVVLQEIQKIHSQDQVIKVQEDQLNALRQTNPKGRLLEWQNLHPEVDVQLESRAQADCLVARVLISLGDGRGFESAFYGASKKVVAEQAAAAEALNWTDNLKLSDDLKQASNLTMESGQSEPGIQHNQPETAPDDAHFSMVQGRISGNPQKVLNEMRQSGVIRDFGFRILETKGVAHQPVFVMEGWVLQESGEELKTGLVERPSKKSGKQEAARVLMADIVEAGIWQIP